MSNKLNEKQLEKTNGGGNATYYYYEFHWHFKYQSDTKTERCTGYTSQNEAQVAMSDKMREIEMKYRNNTYPAVIDDHYVGVDNNYNPIIRTRL